MCPQSGQAGASPIISPRTSCTVVTEFEVASVVSKASTSLTFVTNCTSVTSFETSVVLELLGGQFLVPQPQVQLFHQQELKAILEQELKAILE